MASQNLDSTYQADEGKQAEQAGQAEQAEQAELKAMSVSKVSHVGSTDRRVSRAVERKLKWKLDLFVLPIVASVYFLASMDRSDLSNALISGLASDLNLSSQDYSNATNMFLVGYVVFQLPGTLLIKKIRAPVQFWAAMILWGLFTTLTVLVKTPGQLAAMRFLVGAAEAFVQGGAFFLSFWYEYHELATRSAIFFSTSTLAGAFNGVLAYGITKNLNGVNNWSAWKWIFLIEGVIPMAFSFVVLLLLPAEPADVRHGFNEEEKEELVRRSRRAHNTAEARLELKKVPRILLSIQFWLFVALYSFSLFCLTSLSNFLPTLVLSFGYNLLDSQLFSVIIYMCGGVGILFWARVADKTNARGATLAASTILEIVGYAMLITLENREARFAAACLVAFSIFPKVVLILSWAAMNFVGYTRRGSSLAFMNMFAQLFSMLGNELYSDPPYYARGNSASLGMSAALLVVSLVLWWYMGYLNKKKHEVQFSEQMIELREKSLEDLGEYHPDFFHTT